MTTTIVSMLDAELCHVCGGGDGDSVGDALKDAGKECLIVGGAGALGGAAAGLVTGPGVGATTVAGAVGGCVAGAGESLIRRAWKGLFG
jgi:hypothetical protein